MLEAKNALKKAKGQVYAALEEPIPSGESVEETADKNALIGVLNRFLSELPQKTRKVFSGYCKKIGFTSCNCFEFVIKYFSS